MSNQQRADLLAQIMSFRNERKAHVPDELVDIDFKVLQDAVNCFELPAVVSEVEDFRRKTVDDKLDFNHLTETSREIINSSLIYSDEVDKFIRIKAANIDREFPDRLKNLFKGVYAEFECNGLEGDDLFDALVITLERRIPKLKARKAIYAILAHLFELCEVFKK